MEALDTPSCQYGHARFVSRGSEAAGLPNVLDLKSGYRHLQLHPDMRDYFVFRYDGLFYRCVALPSGWPIGALLYQVDAARRGVHPGQMELAYLAVSGRLPTRTCTNWSRRDCGRLCGGAQASLKAVPSPWIEQAPDEGVLGGHPETGSPGRAHRFGADARAGGGLEDCEGAEADVADAGVVEEE